VTFRTGDYGEVPALGHADEAGGGGEAERHPGGRWCRKGRWLARGGRIGAQAQPALSPSGDAWTEQAPSATGLLAVNPTAIMALAREMPYRRAGQVDERPAALEGAYCAPKVSLPPWHPAPRPLLLHLRVPAPPV
jgi:hypothetical protein